MLIPVGTAQLTNLLARSSGAGAIEGQAEEAAVVKGLVALGLMPGGDRRPPPHRRVEPCGEVTEGSGAEALGNVESAAGLGTNQRLNACEARAAPPPAHQQSPPQGSGGNVPFRTAIAREA